VEWHYVNEVEWHYVNDLEWHHEYDLSLCIPPLPMHTTSYYAYHLSPHILHTQAISTSIHGAQCVEVLVPQAGIGYALIRRAYKPRL